jgi:histidinol-phosphate aminotransferase
MTMRPRPNALVKQLPATIPFVSPEIIERQSGTAFVARLGANECNFGPSPAALVAMGEAAKSDGWKYPVPGCTALAGALSAHYDIDENRFTFAPGIDALLGLTVRVFSEPGAAIVTSDGAYPTFNYHVAAYGRKLVKVPYKHHHEDLDGLADAARKHDAAIVYLSNPDNPMGSWWSADAIIDFANSLAGDTLLILDEAYGEIAPPGTIPALDALPDSVMRMRTFSKAYGLAGLRIGYAIGAPDLVAQYDKVRDHFAVNVVGQAGAVAALKDQAYLQKTINAINAACGLSPISSATSFVTFETKGDGQYAMAILEELAARNAFIRKPMAPGLDHCIRISAGRMEEIDHFEAVLPEALKAAAGHS